MKYSIDWLKTIKNPDYLFFFGYQPVPGESVDASCMSQSAPFPVTFEGHLYPSAEHFMMAAKARLFGDLDIAVKILEQESASAVKVLGRQIRNFNPGVWDAHKYELIRQGNFLKFSQDLVLKDFLMSTGQLILAEANPDDRIWGIGLRAEDAEVKDCKSWKGANLLGFALMEVRDQIQLL
jgi:ribA/ribD-fused uncharacterized protein